MSDHTKTPRTANIGQDEDPNWLLGPRDGDFLLNPVAAVITRGSGTVALDAANAANAALVLEARKADKVIYDLWALCQKHSIPDNIMPYLRFEERRAALALAEGSHP